MSKEEAMKLALEMVQNKMYAHAEMYLKEALAEQPAQQEPVAVLFGSLPVYDKPAQQEPVAFFKWLPEGATHIGRISVRTAAGGSLAMTTYVFKYDSAVLKVYVTDNDNEYPGWRDAKDCFFHLNFPVLPLYTTPQPAQRTWVGLTDEEMQALWDRYAHMEMMRAIEAKLKEKNNG